MEEFSNQAGTCSSFIYIVWYSYTESYAAGVHRKEHSYALVLFLSADT